MSALSLLFGFILSIVLVFAIYIVIKYHRMYNEKCPKCNKKMECEQTESNPSGMWLKFKCPHCNSQYEVYKEDVIKK